MLRRYLIMDRDPKRLDAFNYQLFKEMARILEKVERRLGEKLFLKGSRCVGPKCAAVRRAYPPGLHGKKSGRRRRAGSEFGQLLREKQKLRFLYGLDDRKIKRYSREAAFGRGVFTENLLALLERRLDNVIFRLGFAESRRIARQAVSHGHTTVNEKTITIPSYQVRSGDSVAIKEASLSSGHFADLEARLKKYEPPRWISLDKNKKIGTIAAMPGLNDTAVNVDITKVKEFYSR